MSRTSAAASSSAVSSALLTVLSTFESITLSKVVSLNSGTPDVSSPPILFLIFNIFNTERPPHATTAPKQNAPSEDVIILRILVPKNIL